MGTIGMVLRLGADRLSIEDRLSGLALPRADPLPMW